MQRYNWVNTFNARDLRYTQTVNEKYTKPLRFIRSDVPHTISDDVKDFLIKNNIRMIIDLRNENVPQKPIDTGRKILSVRKNHLNSL